MGAFFFQVHRLRDECYESTPSQSNMTIKKFETVVESAFECETTVKAIKRVLSAMLTCSCPLLLPPPPHVNGALTSDK